MTTSCVVKDSSSSIVVDSLKVSNCVFVGNRAEIGGAIYVKDAQYIEISRNNFTHNNANSYGGDISGYLSKTQISDASFLVQSYFSINTNLFSWNQVVVVEVLELHWLLDTLNIIMTSPKIHSIEIQLLPQGNLELNYCYYFYYYYYYYYYYFFFCHHYC